MAGKRICLDTNVLVHAFLPREGQEEMTERALNLIETINKDKNFIIIPADVLAELMVTVPDGRVLEFFEFFGNNFQIVNFDSLAALQYRKIYREKKPEFCSPEYKRCSMAMDIRVMSTAIASGASTIFTEDKNFTKIASDYIQTLPMPNLPNRQLSLISKTMQ